MMDGRSLTRMVAGATLVASPLLAALVVMTVIHGVLFAVAVMAAAGVGVAAVLLGVRLLEQRA